MKLERFLAERTVRWDELQSIVDRAGSRASSLPAPDIHRLGELYRLGASDLALARRLYPGSPGAERLEGLVASAHALVYARAAREETAGLFLGRTLWRRIFAHRKLIVLAAAVLFGSMVLGALWAMSEPIAAAGLLPAGFHVAPNTRGGFYGVSLPARGGLAVAIFTNNIEVCLLSIGGGFTFGVVTVFSLAYNGALVGVLGTLEWRAGDLSQFVRLVVPHGLLELSCISLAGAGGLAIARALIDPGRKTRSAALAGMVPGLGAIIIGVMLFLTVAGLTEGIITPYDLPLPAALAVGITLSGCFWAAVVVRGRPSPDVKEILGSPQSLPNGPLWNT